MMLRFLASTTALFAFSLPLDSAMALQANRSSQAIEGRISVGGTASLYTRVIGRGQPVIVLHGGRW